METRAPYVIVGLFVLAAIGAVFGFVYWLNNMGGLGERRVYRVQFDTPVSGLLVGAAVLFNGIRVGEVTELVLPPNRARQVVAGISVAAATPIRRDTKAGLEFQGLTGVPVIALEGGEADVAVEPGTTLVADPAASQSMTLAARNALVKVDNLMSENLGPIRELVGNLKVFSDALARNSGRVDGILAGVEKMAGGGASPPPKTIYDLIAPTQFAASGRASTAQLSVAEPTVTLQLDTQRIIVDPAPAPVEFAEAQWGDAIPKLVQARLVQGFENFSLQRAVTRASSDLPADEQLLVDIRRFQISRSEAPVADVALTAKLVTKGQISGTRIFESKVALVALDPASSVKAINEAFANVASQLIVWASTAR